MNLTETHQHKYNALHSPNQLIYGTGTVVVVTGWTPKEAVAKYLQPHEYAVIGNLYSAAGASILIRNLLNNPFVTGIILIQATEQDKLLKPVEELYYFLNNCAPNKDIYKHIADISPSDLERVQKLNHQWTDKVNKNLHYYCQYLEDCQPLGGEPKQYPLPQPTATIYPGHFYGHRIEGKTIADAWVKILHRIRTTGRIRPTGYDGNWQELIDAMAVVTDEPEDFYFPTPNYLPCDREYLESYIPQVIEDGSHGVKYTYGQRLRSWFGVDQIEQCINKLVGEIDAASAVMNLWDTADHEKGGSPCLNHIWVRVLDGELSLTATLRSNDMFNAWVTNAMALRALQRHVKQEVESRLGVELKMGALITISQSAHIYDSAWQSADEIVESHYAKLTQPAYDDPVGNYLIKVDFDKDKIVVDRLHPKTGEVVDSYRDSNPLRLLRMLVEDAPAMQPAHAGYLGMELQRAKEAIILGVAYRQDAK